MISIDDLKRDLLEYDLYWLSDAVEYGDYYLTIINENDSIIIIHIEDVKGLASWVMNKEEFLNIGTSEELEKHIDNILYYNYIEYERE